MAAEEANILPLTSSTPSNYEYSEPATHCAYYKYSASQDVHFELFIIQFRVSRRDPLNAETLSRGRSKPPLLLDSPTLLWQAGSLTIRGLYRNQWQLSQSLCLRLFKWHCGSRAQVRVSAEKSAGENGPEDGMLPEGRRAERRAVERRATAQYMCRLCQDFYSACPYNIHTKMWTPEAHRLLCPRG
jgi:hypothetical protein